MGEKRAAELSDGQSEIMEQLPEKAKSIYDANKKKPQWSKIITHKVQ